jgi:hypothetical protein
MEDLHVNIDDLLPCFVHIQEEPYIFIQVPEECAAAWVSNLGLPVRDCYVANDVLDANVLRTGLPREDLVKAKLPDRGATMAGDFGEILTYLYHAVHEHPVVTIGPKKWRLKHDRTKPAPGSDVIHFVLPVWPASSTEDKIICSEVKTKSTTAPSTPIPSAIEDCKKDQVSRLAKTLVWLKEQALFDDLGSTTIAHLDRFIQSTDHPPAQKHFHAVAVVCSSLIGDELGSAPTDAPEGYKLVVISVPNLKKLYESVFDAAIASAESGDGDIS